MTLCLHIKFTEFAENVSFVKLSLLQPMAAIVQYYAHTDGIGTSCPKALTFLKLLTWVVAKRTKTNGISWKTVNSPLEFLKIFKIDNVFKNRRLQREKIQCFSLVNFIRWNMGYLLWNKEITKKWFQYAFWAISGFVTLCSWTGSWCSKPNFFCPKVRPWFQIYTRRPNFLIAPIVSRKNKIEPSAKLLDVSILVKTAGKKASTEIESFII